MGSRTYLQIEPISLLKDNYAWLLHDTRSGIVAVVDPSEAAPVIQLLEARGLGLDLVINTHHHWDHVGGNSGLKEHFGCRVLGPSYDEHRLVGLDGGLSEGDDVTVGDSVAKVLHIPGHTMGHVALWFADEGAVFVGDTLFALGCGRMFEGTPEVMWHSLKRLAALPAATRVYCGHEYTEANARFAMAIDPDNADLRARALEVRKLRERGLPTVPSTIDQELRTNPFLRATTAAMFGDLRARKDVFAG